MAFRLLATLLAAMSLGASRAAEFQFHPERYTILTLVTTTGRERVTVETWDDARDTNRTTFDATLTPKSPGVYLTPAGTRFTLEHLAAPAVNDPNHGINSGDWRLRVAGKAAELANFERAVPNESSSNPPSFVWFGTRTKD